MGLMRPTHCSFCANLFRDFLDELGLKADLAKSWNLAVDVVITFDETNASHLGSNLYHRRRTLDFQVLDHRHGVTIQQEISHAVTELARVVGWRPRGPFMSTFRAIEEGIDLIGIGGGTRGAGRQAVSHAFQPIAKYLHWNQQKLGRSVREAVALALVAGGIWRRMAE